MGGAIASVAESHGWLKEQARVSASRSSALSLDIAGAPMAAAAQPVTEKASCCTPSPVLIPATLNMAVAVPVGTSSCSCSESALELPRVSKPVGEPAKLAVTV